LSGTGNVVRLRDSIALAIRRGIMAGTGAEGMADAILGLLDREQGERCQDPDCARIRPHGRLDAHLWRHPAEAPFDRVLFGWACFTCGLRRGHRIHRGLGKEKP